MRTIGKAELPRASTCRHHLHEKYDDTSALMQLPAGRESAAANLPPKPDGCDRGC